MAVAQRSTRRLLANAIRALSMDAVEQANSGHPGMPMGMADIAEVLWNDYLRHNPANPRWADRDRFVLSNGHGSMLLYSLLHLTGYDLPLEELRNFRQLGSKTPGHPEYGVTPGVEATTGPLGQGLAMSVGMALAERLLAGQFNRDGFPLVDHHTYVFAGDGCLMEGISHEACSLAGTLGLGKLIVLYDDNGISIDGEVQGWFRDDTPKRFEGYNWHVVPNVDGHDADAVKAALDQAHAETARPTIICCKTVIGWGAPNKAGTAGAHGAALGEEEVAAARKQLGWEHEPFKIPQALYDGWDARERGAELEAGWQGLFERYRSAHPELAAEFERRMMGGLPEEWDSVISGYLVQTQAAGKSTASRKSSQATLDAIASSLPELLGGSADLTGSNNTKWSDAKPVEPGKLEGNYVYFGVREFGMTAALNGITLHGGFLPFGGTFLTFSDYARNAVRLAALMGISNILVYTHDSIGLGEDGPTHQPIEHLASLRLIPNLDVWRPCDAVETGVAWRAAIERRDGPVAMALSRQNLQHQVRNEDQLQTVRRGGYILHEPEGAPQGVIIATGSEVGLAVKAAHRLAGQGYLVRVVSMPCVDVFQRQDAGYRELVLPPVLPLRLAVEAGVGNGWWELVGSRGAVLGIDHYGESAPGEDVFNHLGLTADHVVEKMQALLDSQRQSGRAASI